MSAAMIGREIRHCRFVGICLVRYQGRVVHVLKNILRPGHYFLRVRWLFSFRFLSTWLFRLNISIFLLIVFEENISVNFCLLMASRMDDSSVFSDSDESLCFIKCKWWNWHWSIEWIWKWWFFHFEWWWECSKTNSMGSCLHLFLSIYDNLTLKFT